MANKANYHLLATSRSELRAPSNFLHPPSHFVTAPWGALGTGFPRPFASLRSEFEDFYPNISPPLTRPRVATVARR